MRKVESELESSREPSRPNPSRMGQTEMKMADLILSTYQARLAQN